MKKKLSNKSGFTLVELSIVMIIIGLLIGAVLKGQEMITNAKIQNTVKDVTAVEAAMSTFRLGYNALPGDMRNATTALHGCGASNFCTNGNGNLFIGEAYADNMAISVKKFNDSETVQFWKHLAIADLISGINAGANPANPEWGETHLKARIAGGFEMMYVQTPILNIQTARGHILRLSVLGLHGSDSGESGAAEDGAGAATGALTPMEAQMVDKKYDDGFPLTGRMIVWDFGNHGCDNRRDGTVGFDPLSEDRACVAFFVLDSR